MFVGFIEFIGFVELALCIEFFVFVGCICRGFDKILSLPIYIGLLSWDFRYLMNPEESFETVSACE